ncbi:MAG: redox-regulated ATPase YchF [Candidatus Aureabacteria bacterium]|nr:redox-regulated ATPase YchF [Candidatus Auribacterota bacterium]
MDVGIIGLPNVGKTTIFNTLAGAHAPSENYPFCTIEPNKAIVAVPERRLDRLAALITHQKIIPAHVEFLDVAGLVEGASRGEGCGNRFLSHIRETEVIAQVVRSFSGEGVAYPFPQINPKKELGVVATELLLADLEVAERALKKAPCEDEKTHLLSTFRDALAGGKALRELSISDGERSCVKEFGFLSLKPLIIVANIGEAQSERERRWVEEREGEAARLGVESISICGAVEQELSALSEEEAAEFLRELNLPERALPRFIQKCYRLLRLVTFFTIEGGIVQAWAVPEGTTAPRAAGYIHTDMEHGFIKAEVIAFDDMDRCGDLSVARAQGLLRIEGKEYLVRDGDVIRYRFAAVKSGK